MPTASPLGVCALSPPPENAPCPVHAAGYVHEILGHRGLSYRRIGQEDLDETLPSLGVLVMVEVNP